MELANHTIAQVGEMMRPRSSGQVVNPHVVPHYKSLEPDYDRMRELAHPTPAKKPEDERKAG